MALSILVLGLGELGREVVKYLSGHPQRKSLPIAVLLRTAANASRRREQVEELQSWNVEVVIGDVTEDSQNHLTSIFQKYHTVICCTGMTAPPATQVKIAKAAVAAEVHRYFPWQYGIDYDKIGRNSSQDLFDSQLDVRDVLRGQTKTSWTIVSTGMFISFVFEPAFDIVNADRSVVTAIGSWDNELTVTAPEDIGRVVAEMALVYPDAQGVVYVSGDTITMEGIAAVVAKVTGKDPIRKLKTVAHLKEELAESPSDGMRKYRVVFAEGVGIAWSKADSFNEQNGIPTQTMEEWAMHNVRQGMRH